MGKKLTYEYVYGFILKKGFKLLSKEYKGDDGKLKMKDKDGYLYFTSYGRMHRSNPSRFFNNNPYTEHNIKLWILKNNRPFSLIDGQKLESGRSKLFFKCHICPSEEIPFVAIWDRIGGGGGCGLCHGKQIGKYNNLAYRFSEIVEWWDYDENNILPSTIAPNSQIKAWWICECGKGFQQIVRERISGRVACKTCARKKWINSKRNNVMNSGKDITITHPELICDWDYENNNLPPNAYTFGSKEDIYWKCFNCEHCWIASMNRRTGFHKSGCPDCSGSKGEKKISNFLKALGINFKKEKTFDDCRWDKNGFLRFDFYILDKNILIEYDGIQHFKPIAFGGISKKKAERNFKTQKLKDKKKNEYCKNNDIDLVRIPYWEHDNIEKILSDIL